MNTAFRSMALTTALVSAAVSAIASPALLGGAPGCVLTVAEAAATWICDRADNICGLDDARMLMKMLAARADAIRKDIAADGA